MRLEQRLLPTGDALDGDLQQRAHVPVQLVLRAVVGVQGDVDRVLRRDGHRELRERGRPGHHVLDAGARQIVRATGRYLDDAVALCLGEAAESSVERLAGGHVDSRVGEALLLGPVKHLRVDLGRRDRHGTESSRAGSGSITGLDDCFQYRGDPWPAKAAGQLCSITEPRPCRVYSADMGHHDADPADRRRYAGFVALSVAVLALLVVGAIALHAFSQH